MDSPKSPVEDPNVKAFQEIERQKYEERKQYREDLLKVWCCL